MLYQIAAITAAAGACLLRSEYEKNCLVTEEYVIASPKLKGREKTFVFLTDLHDKEFGKNNKTLLEAVRAVRPDAVLSGGDMIVAKGQRKLSASLSLFEALAKEFPVYCGNGNHELRMKKQTDIYGDAYESYTNALRSFGVHILSDEGVRITEDLILYGVDLADRHYRPGTPKMEHIYLKDALGGVNPKPFSILLAHSPVFFEEYAEWGADLTLSGHFHGGTIRLPFFGGLMTPQYQFFYPRCGGFTDKNGKKMIVGRGLGTHSVNVRLNNKPQVIVVRLKPKNNI